MNKTLFNIFMIKNHDNQTILAKAMGMAQSALSDRINGKTEFRQNEINFIRMRWGLTDQEVIDIFFTQEVSEKDTEKGA